MIATLPSELEPFVQAEVESGRFASADDVVSAAVRFFREMTTQPRPTSEDLEFLRREIQLGRDDIAHGRVRQINTEAESRAFAEEIKTRGRARLNAERATP